MTIDIEESIDKAISEGRYSSLFVDAKRESAKYEISTDTIKLRVTFNTLVPKRVIYGIESDIKKEIFGRESGNVRIIERFNLSSNYNAKVLWDSYKDSLITELAAYNQLMKMCLQRADIEFTDDNSMTITVEDNCLFSHIEGEMIDILNRIFSVRCGIDAVITLKHKAISTANIDSIDDDTFIAVHPKSESVPEPEVVEESNKTNKNTKAVKSQKNSIKKSDNPNVVYGRDVEDNARAIEDISLEGEDVVIRGKLCNVEHTVTRTGFNIISAVVTDFTDSIAIKLFSNNEDDAKEIVSGLKDAGFIKISGRVENDKFSHELTVTNIRGIVKIPDFTTVRMDTAEEKRVELHCHTKMSEYDGVSEAEDIINRMKKWGHKAVAITDHGNVQAFTPASHALKRGDDFKIIYGCEGYLVDDTKSLVAGDDSRDFSGDFVVFDIETTGFNSKKDKIIEIGACKVSNGEVIDSFSEFVNPLIPIPFRIVELTSIRDEDVINSPTIDIILPKFLDFCKDCVVVAHNAEFDVSFIKAKSLELGMTFDNTYLDTMTLTRFLVPSLGRVNLDRVAKHFDLVNEHHHRAVDDANVTAKIFIKEIALLRDLCIDNLNQLKIQGKFSAEAIKKERPNHVIILAKNDIGRINLYKLVSEAHINYFSGKPKIPKSLINENRDGLIIGSACCAGELYQAILRERSEDEIARIVEFYDYLEVQPDGNNSFMIASEKGDYENINSLEDLHDITRRIIALGEEFNKPVVATSDAHYIDPEDAIYRTILLAAKDMDEEDDDSLFIKTTDEMLDEFAYLGKDKAREIVVTNTNLINNMIEKIEPVRPDKCPPVIENADETLRTICYTRAHQMYGPNLPEPVQARLDRELNSIIGNGYAVMYIIAQKLVWKSNEDGYLVGSRGSVGSSFAATMSGITEVNPLSPHYLCSECYYVDFDSPEVLEFSGRAGCDMPDKVCPKCGAPLTKQGFDIPFETFLGFYGDKEPDIDLNFSSDYQTKAHRYVEVIFGEGQTFKAGTVGTVADKTAYGLVKKYYEGKGITKRPCEIDRLLQGCVGVKNTTGQHPGGVIVLPMGEDIYSFTPIQHPANKDTDIVTTHFDYHSIDQNLLKLDILGHADPTMIKNLEELIGFDATKIPLDDKNVMSLFQNTSALGVTPDDLMGTYMGTLGIPEFGTEFAMGMLRDAKPQEFTDLVRISGLSHGTDVWLGNAKDLILSGQATISTAICTRDDIMTYLIHQGVEPGDAFKIMENVRKGTVAKGKCEKWPEYEADMLAHDVPQWYIDSCKKIKYMFPKAHAVAYVMMAWRVAYCKIYYPLEYYASFFSIRADNFDYEMMCLGREKIERHIKAFQNADKLSAKEDGLLKDMKIVQEMYARGFEFLPMDLYKSDDRYFKVEDGKLRPPFTSIEGMGDKAAEMLKIAAAVGPFTSIDDVKDRGKVSGTILEKMKELGILEGLPQSNQYSLFDNL